MGMFDFLKKKEKKRELTDEEKLYKQYPIIKTLNAKQKRKLLREINRRIGK